MRFKLQYILPRKRHSSHGWSRASSVWVFWRNSCKNYVLVSMSIVKSPVNKNMADFFPFVLFFASAPLYKLFKMSVNEFSHAAPHTIKAEYSDYLRATSVFPQILWRLKGKFYFLSVFYTFSLTLHRFYRQTHFFAILLSFMYSLLNF